MIPSFIEELKFCQSTYVGHWGFVEPAPTPCKKSPQSLGAVDHSPAKVTPKFCWLWSGLTRSEWIGRNE